MFRKETYVRRRSELRKRIEGGLVLLPGNGESPANYPSNQFRFRQDSTFLYFFGLNRPDYVGLMDIDSGEETLYGDDYTIDDIIWMGPQPTLDEQAREVGIGKTLCRPGVVEREIAGAIESIALQHGAGVSFFSIVSQHGETLHNHCHEGTLLSGRLMLVDAGAETTMNYCSDFTRTFPVSGRFTQKQKDVYDIVLAANDRTFSLAGPDSYYYRMHNEASLVIAEGLKSLGLMRGDMQDAVTVGAQALFMPHGLGHQMGLDVHDMENIGEKYVGYDEQTLRSSTPGLSSLRMGKRLREGMVITVEPGIYFIPALIEKWEREGLGGGFIDFAKVREYLDFGGIRIEDDMLITSFGNRLLGGNRPPVTTAQIEEYMND